jgi:hypothetical protein
MDALDYINNLENGQENVARITNKLFSVVDLPVTANMVYGTYMDRFSDGAIIQNPEGQVIYTSDGRYLGQIGSTYESLQPSDFFKTIVESVEGCNLEGYDLNKLKYREYKGGKIIQFDLELPEPILFKNKAGKMDEIRTSLSFKTGFAGIMKTMLEVNTFRTVCSNGMKAWVKAKALAFKHTTRQNAKAVLFCNEIVETTRQAQNLEDYMRALDSVEITNKQIDEYCRKLVGIRLDEDLTSQTCEVSTRRKNIFASLKEAMDVELPRTGRTAFGALQGATYYTNHLASGASEEYVQVAQGSKINTHAQKLSFELAGLN